MGSEPPLQAGRSCLLVESAVRARIDVARLIKIRACRFRQWLGGDLPRVASLRQFSIRIAGCQFVTKHGFDRRPADEHFAATVTSGPDDGLGRELRLKN